MMINIEINKTLEEQFAKECKVINLKFEYENYTGKERYAIVTSLTEEELTEKYDNVIKHSYAPYVLLSVEQGNAIVKYQNIEAKYRMRDLRFGHAFDIDDGEFEEHHPELAVYEDLTEKIELQNNIRKLEFAIRTLSEVQKRRLIKHFFDGKNYSQIGVEEGVDYTSVKESITSAIKKLKKFF